MQMTEPQTSHSANERRGWRTPSVRQMKISGRAQIIQEVQEDRRRGSLSTPRAGPSRMSQAAPPHIKTRLQRAHGQGVWKAED